MKVTRRDLLVWSAGAAAGLVVTPVPWKLLDDVSIWSQNWPWIPQPARGPVDVKQSACALCPRGCGIKVRMAGGWPVGVAGVINHPVTRGALCPLAFGAHQLNWHPKRLRTVHRQASSSSWVEAQAAFAKACAEGPVVVIDGYPGRAESLVLETFAQNRNGQYHVVLSPEIRSLIPYETWSGIPATALGYDIENAQTIVSFGAPLLDGWGSPGQFSRLWAERAAGMTDPKLRLIQVEAELSRTATRAWRWVAIHQGAEAALAAGLARVLLEDRLVRARLPMPALTLTDAAVRSGITPDAIRDLARTIVANPPVVAIADDDNPAIAALNIVLGSIGTPGGIVKKTKAAKSYLAADSASSPARAVLIDASVPWEFTPQTDAEVFRFAAWDGGSSKADWLLPAPGFLEALADVPTAPAFPVETYTIASSLVKAPHEVHSAAQFVRTIDPSLPAMEKIIHTRCEDVFRRRLGTLHAQEQAPVATLPSALKLEEELRKGAVWVGEPLRVGFRCEMKEWPTISDSATSANWTESWSAPVLPPLASKLCRESNLREAPQGRNA